MAEPDRLPFDPLQDAGGQDDPVTVDGWQPVEGDLQAALLVRRQRDDAPAVDVALAHPLSDVGVEPLRRRPVGSEDLEGDAVLAEVALVGAPHQHRQRRAPAGDQVEPELHAGQLLVEAGRQVHVVDRAFRASPLRPPARVLWRP